MERPPALDVPTIQFDGVWVDLVTGEVQLFEQTSPAVLAGAWQAPSGSRAILLANITDQAQTFQLIPPQPDGGAPFVVSLVVNGARTVLAEGAAAPPTVSVSLDPLAVAMLEVTPRPWRSAGGGRGPAGRDSRMDVERPTSNFER